MRIKIMSNRLIKNMLNSRPLHKPRPSAIFSIIDTNKKRWKKPTKALH